MKQVHENIYRGPRPKSLSLLKMEDIGVVISLQSGFYQAINDDKFEVDHPLDYDMRAFYYPMSDFSVPDRTMVRQIVWRLVNESRLRKVYLHCLHGVDRTGYVIAAYRMIVNGWTYKLAVKEMMDEGFHKFPYFYWINSLKGV